MWFDIYAGDADGLKAKLMSSLFDRVGWCHGVLFGGGVETGGGRSEEQPNMTPNRAEQCSDLQVSHVPVIRLIQSVCLSSKRQVVAPPFEMLDQGRVVPGKFATTQPRRNGTWQLRRASPLAMPKLQTDSVVAVESASERAVEPAIREAATGTINTIHLI